MSTRTRKNKETGLFVRFNNAMEQLIRPRGVDSTHQISVVLALLPFKINLVTRLTKVKILATVFLMQIRNLLRRTDLTVLRFNKVRTVRLSPRVRTVHRIARFLEDVVVFSAGLMHGFIANQLMSKNISIVSRIARCYQKNCKLN